MRTLLKIAIVVTALVTLAITVDAQEVPIGDLGCRMERGYTDCVATKLESIYQDDRRRLGVARATASALRRVALNAVSCAKGASTLAETSGYSNVVEKNKWLPHVTEATEFAINSLTDNLDQTMVDNGWTDVPKYVDYLIWEVKDDWDLSYLGGFNVDEFRTKWFNAWDDSLTERRKHVVVAYRHFCGEPDEPGSFEETMQENIIRYQREWLEDWGFKYNL